VFFIGCWEVQRLCINSSIALVLGEVSLESHGLRGLHSGRPPLLPLPSPPSLSLSLSSSSSGSGSPPVFPGGGGGWLFPPKSTFFSLFCRGVDADSLSQLIPSGGIQGFRCPWIEGPGSPSPPSVGGMLYWGFSARSILAVEVCINAWNSNHCLSRRSLASWQSFCCWAAALSFWSFSS